MTYQVGDLVLVAALGLEGTVTEVNDGPLETYEVLYQGGLGHGTHEARELHTADLDYPELGDVLYERPTPEVALMRTASRDPQQEADDDNCYHDSRCHHTSLGRWMRHFMASAPGDPDWEARWHADPEVARHVHGAMEGADAYRRNRGLWTPNHDYTKVMADRDRHQAIAQHYLDAPEDDSRVHGSFEAMRGEIHDQFHHLTHNMGIHVQVTDHDPYRNHHDMVDDVARHGRLQVLGTHMTGSHPIFSDEENDKFRAVHDFFGHAATRRGFDRNGEEAAWLHHATMFSPRARPALTSETRGQNAALIYTGKFQPQKQVMLPEHFWNEDSLHSVRKTADAFSLGTSSPGSVGDPENRHTDLEAVHNTDIATYPAGTICPLCNHNPVQTSVNHTPVCNWCAEHRYGIPIPSGQDQQFGQTTAALNSEDEIPARPGTTPIPEGHVRLFHYTSTAALPSIREHGLHRDFAKGETYGEPSVVWAAAGVPKGDSFHTHNYVEFHAHPAHDLDIGAMGGVAGRHGEEPNPEAMANHTKWLEERHAHVTMRGNVPPENIVAIHEPWHTGYHYMHDDPEMRERVKGGEYDWVHDDPGTEAQYGKAVRRIKAEGVRRIAMQWTWDVDYADDKDALKRGEVRSGTHRVTVEAEDHPTAMAMANEMLFARGKEPTKATLVHYTAAVQEDEEEPEEEAQPQAPPHPPGYRYDWNGGGHSMWDDRIRRHRPSFHILGGVPSYSDELGGGVREQWHPGDRAHYEYHCYEGDDSSDADLWHRSHNPVTVVRQHRQGETDYLEPGNFLDRAEAGMPKTYHIRFDNGHEGTAWEDELLTHPRHYIRDDPPGHIKTGMAWDEHGPGGMSAEDAGARSVRHAGFKGYVGASDWDDRAGLRGHDPHGFNEDLWEEHTPEPTPEEEAHYQEHKEYPESFYERHERAYGHAMDERNGEEIPDHIDDHLHHWTAEHSTDARSFTRHAHQPQQVDLRNGVYATQSHVGQFHIDRYLHDEEDEPWSHQSRPDMVHMPYLGDEHPLFVTHQGRLHTIEGHHRVAAALQRGDSHIEGWHHDLDKHPIEGGCEECHYYHHGEYPDEMEHTAEYHKLGPGKGHYFEPQEDNPNRCAECGHDRRSTSHPKPPLEKEATRWPAYEMIPVHKLVQWADPDMPNYAGHRDQIDQLAGSIAEHGYRPEMEEDPIRVLTRGDDGAVLEGHHRIWAAHELGLYELPVVRHKAGRDLDDLAHRGYCTEDWNRWQQGECSHYAAGLQRLRPSLRIGHLDDGSHFFAHDDTHAYDSAGKHPLPYHGVHGYAKPELEQRLEDWGEPGDSSGPEGPETHIQEAMEHARRNGILEGRFGPNTHHLGSFLDVQQKAKRMRLEGRVRILELPRPDNPYLFGEVEGDHGVYHPLIHQAGRARFQAVCDCRWGDLMEFGPDHGLRDPHSPWLKRMCAHLLALMYTFQSGSMFGREPVVVKAKVRATEKPQKCEWCKNPAVKSYLWAEGMAYIPTCDKHEDKTRSCIEDENNDEVSAVHTVRKSAKVITDPEEHVNADGSAHSGIMAALRIPKSHAEDMAVEGGEKPQDMHVTLAYMGKVGEVDEDALHKAAEDFASRHGSLDGKVTGFGNFEVDPERNDGFSHCHIGLVSIPHIDAFRTELVRTLKDHGITPSEEFGLQPHMTIAYAHEPMQYDEMPKVTDEAMHFPHLTIAHGSTWRHYPLTGGKPGDSAAHTGVANPLYHVTTEEAVPSIEHHGLDNTRSEYELWSNTDDWDDGAYLWQGHDKAHRYAQDLKEMGHKPVIYDVDTHGLDLHPDRTGDHSEHTEGAWHVDHVPVDRLHRHECALNGSGTRHTGAAHCPSCGEEEPYHAYGCEQTQAPHKYWGKQDLETMFPGESPTVSAPFKGHDTFRTHRFDQTAVTKSLIEQPEHEIRHMDPRGFRATQPLVTRTGVNYYLGDTYEKTGRTYADEHNAGNKTPVVFTYHHPRTGEEQHMLLSGHHRAAAALLRGEPLKVRNIQGELVPR